jgi:hypothetical protein
VIFDVDVAGHDVRVEGLAPLRNVATWSNEARGFLVAATDDRFGFARLD